jgi:hypothetical protein
MVMTKPENWIDDFLKASAERAAAKNRGEVRPTVQFKEIDGEIREVLPGNRSRLPGAAPARRQKRRPQPGVKG